MLFDENLFVPNLTRYTGHKFMVSKKKGEVLQKTLAVVPDNTRTIYEPFAGLACISWNVIAQNRLENLERVVLSDMNPYLVNLFNNIKDHPDKLLNGCEDILTSDVINKSKFYELRDELNAVDPVNSNSAITLVLMKNMGANGMKLNKDGKSGLCIENINQSFEKQEKWLRELTDSVNAHNVLMNGDVEVTYSNDNFYDFNPVVSSDNLVILDPPYDGSKINYGASTDGLYGKIYKYIEDTCNNQHFIIFNYLDEVQQLKDTMLKFWFICSNFNYSATNQKFNIQHSGGNPDKQCGMEIMMHNTNLGHNSRI